MIESWKSFLEQSGAEFDGNRVTAFGDTQGELHAAADGDVIADLSHFAVVRAKGEDAQSFLQNQFGNDVRLVSDDFSQLSSYSSPKGRMLAIFRLFGRDGDHYLRLSAPLLEGFLKRLRMFVLMSKVSLDDVSDALVRIGVAGEKVAERLRGLVGSVPEAVDAAIQANGITVLRVPGIRPRFEVYGSEAAVRGLWESLSETARTVGADAWEWLEVQAGLPTVYPETVEAFVPQMTNMQLIGGVSFKKGCYPGQEIVARMQYLGQLKRRMYLAHVESTTRPLPGDSLFSPECGSGQGTGKVVAAAPAPAGGYDLLAVIQIECAERGDVRLGENGPALELLPLPYSFEAPEGIPT